MLKKSAAAAMCFCASATAYADLTEAETLQRWNGVMVIVETLHDDAKHINLTTEALDGDVRGKLKAAGVKIFSKEERLADERQPYLYINCNIIFVESIGFTSFSIDVEAHQRVTLVNGAKAQGLTWAKSYTGVQGRDTAAPKIRNVVGAYVDQFIAAMAAGDAEAGSA